MLENNAAANIFYKSYFLKEISSRKNCWHKKLKKNDKNVIEIISAKLNAKLERIDKLTKINRKSFW